jgi:hypothetical protein
VKLISGLKHIFFAVIVNQLFFAHVHWVQIGFDNIENVACGFDKLETYLSDEQITGKKIKISGIIYSREIHEDTSLDSGLGQIVITS